MAYNILKTDGTPLLDGDSNPVIIQNNTVLPAGLAGNSLDLTLYGKGKRDYGKDWNENFVRLLENFADTSAPNFPQDGMIWFDESGSPALNKLRYRAGGAWSTVASEAYVASEIGALLGSPSGLGPLPWSGSAAPSGWLLCDGTSYATATYPLLFAAIGYVFGGSGANFNVPDMRGRFPLGLNDTGSGVNRVNRTASQNMAGVDGDENVTLTSTQMPVHTHTQSGTATAAAVGNHTHTASTTGAGGHSHTFEYANINVEFNGGGVTNSFMSGTGLTETTTSVGNHTHAVTVNGAGGHSHTVSGVVLNNAGSGGSHENTPPFLTVRYIIKT